MGSTRVKRHRAQLIDRSCAPIEHKSHRRTLRDLIDSPKICGPATSFLLSRRSRAWGVSAAAAAENVSQPTISTTIRRLERQLRLDLLYRVGSGMKLTPAGHGFLAPARRIARAAGLLETSVSRNELRGRVNILAAPGLAVGRWCAWSRI